MKLEITICSPVVVTAESDDSREAVDEVLSQHPWFIPYSVSDGTGREFCVIGECSGCGKHLFQFDDPCYDGLDHFCQECFDLGEIDEGD